MRARLLGAARWRAVVTATLVTSLAGAVAGCDVEVPETSPTSPPPTVEVTPGAPTPTPTPSEPVTFEDASSAYETCLGDRGVEPDELPVGQNLDALADLADAPDAVLAELEVERRVVLAHADCWPAFAAAIADGATPDDEPSAEPDDEPSVEPSVDPEAAARMHEAVACLVDRGWDFLEPGEETGPLTMQPRSEGFDWEDEAFLLDQRECQQLAGMMG